MAPKAEKKPVKKVVKKSAKKSKKSVETYKIYIYKVLKQVRNAHHLSKLFASPVWGLMVLSEMTLNSYGGCLVSRNLS